MTPQDWITRFPGSADVLAMLGLERRDPSETLASAFAIFGAGLAVGAALALLLAPKSGAELRGDLGEQMSRLRGVKAATNS